MLRKILFYSVISFTFLNFVNLNAMFSSQQAEERTFCSKSVKVKVSPTVDIAFKKVFGEEKNKGILIHFLNSILERTTDPIVDLQFANTEIQPEALADKLSRLDVLVRTNKNEIINIEIQVKNTGNIVDRSLYYASKLISQSLSSGQSYQSLPKFIMINLLGYKAFNDETRHRTVALMDTVKHEKYTDMLEFHFFELPKYTAPTTNSAEAWIFFLKDPNDGSFTNPQTPEEFTAAREALLMLEKDSIFVNQYEQREKDVRDQISAVESALQKQREEYINEKEEVVRRMKSSSLLSVEQIAQFTGLTKEQVESIN